MMPLVLPVCIVITHERKTGYPEIWLAASLPLEVEHGGNIMPDQCTDTSACFAITEEQIAKRAYALWESRGCPLGNDTADWQTAREQLLAENRSSLAYLAHAGIDLTDIITPSVHHKTHPIERGGLLSRWMNLLRKAG